MQHITALIGLTGIGIAIASITALLFVVCNTAIKDMRGIGSNYALERFYDGLIGLSLVGLLIGAVLLSAAIILTGN